MTHEKEKNVKYLKEALRENLKNSKELHNEHNRFELKIDFAIIKYKELSFQNQYEDVDNEKIIEDLKHNW